MSQPDNETKSYYQVAKALRAFLIDLPPGEYKPEELTKRILRAEIVKAWELSGSSILNAIRSLPKEQAERWVHNGQKTRGSAWTKTPPPAQPPAEQRHLLEVEGPSADERISRLERMMERICNQLGVSTE